MEKLPSWDASRWTGLWRSSPASCLALHRFGILVPADWRARDTLFPLLSTNRVRIDLITICKMLGHKDVKMTQRYARVTQKKLFEDMDKFIAATEKDFILALWTRLSTFLFTVSTTLLYYKDNNYEQKYILKTSVFNFCGSMLPGFADFNAKNNKKNLHDCNEYMNNDELRNTLKFSQLSRYANKQATTKLPRYTQSVAWLHSVHLLCTRQSVNGANRDHYTNNLNNVSYGKNKRCRIVLTVSSASSEGGAWAYRASSRTSCATT